jgi:hypothetical protein
MTSPISASNSEPKTLANRKVREEREGKSFYSFCYRTSEIKGQS